MSTSIDHLLKPRYKVIADFPKAKYIVGEILHVVDSIDEADRFPFQQGHSPIMNDAGQFDKYPHLFKKLQWWEDRKSEEMPEYVIRSKMDKSKEVLRVLHPSCNSRIFGHEDNTIEHRFIYPEARGFTPATEAEYLNHINKKQ